MSEVEVTDDDLDRYVLNKKEEAGIRYKLQKYAFKECFYLTEKYGDCTKSRWFSVLRCRGELAELERCLAQVSSEEAFEDMRRDYIRQQLRKRAAAN